MTALHCQRELDRSCLDHARLDEARRLTEAFNKAVDHSLGDLAISPATKLYRLDVAAMAERARKDPASYGFTNITTPCHASGQCEKYLFWDDIHPTTAAHAHLAEGALRVLSLQQVR